ncbi:ABC transporter substrate-binding protein [Ruminococcaceae bacterium OttesenSCG-928-I18]|nr:ABC transporter substrate-binding protein [Ruminococcaceae bacterium OttesenSCG-928-I18]
MTSKKWFAGVLAMITLLAFTACSGAGSSSVTQGGSVSLDVAAHSVPPAGSAPTEGPQATEGTVRVAGLKGPTTMGMVRLMKDAEEGLAGHRYEVEMFGTADEIVPKLVSGEIDVAAVPANLASVLYNNTGGGVSVAAINTLGVLYVVETAEEIQSVQDLRGRTVYSTGKGTTPEFVLNYILTQNGLQPGTDVTIEYKSESTEVAALLAEEEGAVAVLPQPYVTGVQMQNEQVRVALDLTEEWDRVGEGSGLVTGVLVARTAFLEEAPELFADFLQEYKQSIEWVNANTAEAAELVAEYGIVEKAPVAEKALPACNITYIDGQEMQMMLQGYLQVLYDQMPESVGGAMPDEAFYYMAP